MLQNLHVKNLAYRRGRYDHVRDQKRTGYGTCDG